MPVPTRDKVTELLTEPVRRHGFDLDDVEVSAAGPKSIVRVIVDSDVGVSLDDIVDLTGIVSEELDAESSFGEAPYTLEVTSRGVDRPLTQPRHWRRSRGRRAEVHIGDEKIIGRIGALDEDHTPVTVQLVIPGKPAPTVREIVIDDVDHAVAQVEFSKPDPREAALAGGSATADDGRDEAGRDNTGRDDSGTAAKEKDK